MPKPRRDPLREARIENEAIVDASPDEQAMSWYYYLESRLSFPFMSKCEAMNLRSPLRKNETVTVLGMAADNLCEHDMLVQVRWQDRKIAVPVSQLQPVGADESTQEAVEDWRYWVGRVVSSERR